MAKQTLMEHGRHARYADESFKRGTGNGGDTFVQNQSATANGANTQLLVKNLTTGATAEICDSYIQFNAGDQDLSGYSTATPNLTVAVYNENNMATTTPFTVDVYGLGTNLSSNGFNESTLVYSGAS